VYHDQVLLFEKGVVVYHNHVISSQLVVVDQVLYTQSYGFSRSYDREILVEVLRNAIYVVGFEGVMCTEKRDQVGSEPDKVNGV